MNFHIYPAFLPKNLKICITAYGNLNGNNSGIFKDRSKPFAPKWRFSGWGNLTASDDLQMSAHPGCAQGQGYRHVTYMIAQKLLLFLAL